MSEKYCRLVDGGRLLRCILSGTWAQSWCFKFYVCFLFFNFWTNSFTFSPLTALIPLLNDFSCFSSLLCSGSELCLSLRLRPSSNSAFIPEVPLNFGFVGSIANSWFSNNLEANRGSLVSILKSSLCMLSSSRLLSLLLCLPFFRARL